jgi:hypothetical protein
VCRGKGRRDARRGVPRGRIIVHAAVAHVDAIYEGITKRSAALDDPPTHERISLRMMARTSPVPPKFCAVETCLGKIARLAKPAGADTATR